MVPRCELVDLVARPTLAVRRRAPVERLPQVLGPAWALVMACAGKAGAVPVDAPFVAYQSMDMRDLDLEIGFVFERPLAGDGDVLAGEIPAGEAVQCVHVGPYDQLGATYGAMRGWMVERGLRHAGPAREFYLDDPQDTPPAELRTLVLLPVG